MFVTEEAMRMPMLESLSELGQHHWWTAQIDSPGFFFMLSLRAGNRGDDDERAGTFFIGNSNFLVEHMSIPGTSILRVDLFLLDLDSYPSYNNHKITSVFVGKGRDEFNPSCEFDVLQMETASGGIKHIFDDMVTDNPPTTDLKVLYKAPTL